MKLSYKLFTKLVKPHLDKVLISCYDIYRSNCIKNNIDYMTFNEFCNYVNEDLKKYND